MKRMKRLAAGLLAAALTIGSLVGCATPKLTDAEYAAKVAATYGDQEIMLSEVNYYLRSVQYTYEMMYSFYYGEDMWEMEVSDSKTMGQSIKEAILSEIYQIYVLSEKAAELKIELSAADLKKVEEAVDEYLEEAPEEVHAEVRLSREELVELYKRNALANRAWEYAVKDTNVEVADKDAAQRKITLISLSDTSKDYKSEEMKDEILAALKSGKKMEDIAKDKKLTASPYYLGEGDYKDSIGPKAMALKKGEYDAVYVEASKAWYVLYCDSEFDEEATESKKETIITERKAAEFEKVYKDWKAKAKEFVVDEDAMKYLTFDGVLYIPETTEADKDGTKEETKDDNTTEAESKEDK